MGDTQPFDLRTSGIGSRPVLAVFGSDSPGSPRPGRRIRFAGNSDLLKLLPDGVAVERLNLGNQLEASGQALRLQGAPDLSRYSCVLNLVTEPELHPRTLGVLTKLLRGYRGRVINRPEALMGTGRDQVAKRLAGIAGLRVPKVVRLPARRLAAAPQIVDRAGFVFPAILRRAGTHSGKVVGKVESAEELVGALAEPADHILTEFADFASEDGLYRKYRMFVFGGKMIFRHMVVGDQWNVHGREKLGFMAHHPALLDEEKHLFATAGAALPKGVMQALHGTIQRMKLDFFGIDFGIDRQGDAVLFEANATMNFFPFLTDPRFDYVRQCIDPARRALVELLGLEPAVLEVA